MMTKTNLRNEFAKVSRLGYCDAQFLLRGAQKVGYNAGVYGWNYDVYRVGSVAIITGYRPDYGYRPNYSIVDRYEEEARKICEEPFTVSYEDKQRRLQALCFDFVGDAFNS